MVSARTICGTAGLDGTTTAAPGVDGTTTVGADGCTTTGGGAGCTTAGRAGCTTTGACASTSVAQAPPVRIVTAVPPARTVRSNRLFIVESPIVDDRFSVGPWIYLSNFPLTKTHRPCQQGRGENG